MQQSEGGQVCQNLSEADQQRELLERVANSRLFSNSHALRAFLLYIGEHAIAGKLDAIKEQQIGCRVFGRKSDYDPAEDNIVRVRARQLRQRLHDYFIGDGRDEPVIISIPKGHYIPVFKPRDNEREPEKLDPLISTVPLNGPVLDLDGNGMQEWNAPPLLRHVRAKSAILSFVLGVLLTVAIAVGLLWFKQDVKSSPDQSAPDPVTKCLWAQLLPPGGPDLTVVSADAGFALWQDISDRNLNLGDYLSRDWYTKDAAGDVKMREIAIRRFTSPADLGLTARIVELAHSYNTHAKVRFARNVDINELRSGNLILLGSRRSNPWVELFEPRMNFVLEFDRERHGPAFRNRAPKPGEPDVVALASRLSVQGPESRLIESYAVAALLPGLADHGNVLILEGLSMEGTEAAGEFVVNPKWFGAFLQKIGQKNTKRIKPFEVLLKLRAVAGGFADPEVVASRYFAQ